MTTPIFRKRLSSCQRQGEIIATVIELARDQRPEAISTQAIADHIGLTQGAIFRHFPSKEAIWLGVFGWVQQSLGGIIEQAVREVESPVGKLEAVFMAHTGFIARYPGVPRILFNDLQNPGESTVRDAVRALVMGYRKRVAQLFVLARQAGELPQGLDELRAAGLFIGALQGLVIQAALLNDNDIMLREAGPVFGLLFNGFHGGCEQ